MDKKVAKKVDKKVAKKVDKKVAKKVDKASQKDASQIEATLNCAREAVATQAQALAQLLPLFDADKEQGRVFSFVIEELANLQGRLIVTGMGKSGHIARKIAATFSSTGTPAYFVHPAEASHGDLGMIMRNDAVLALSSSGETEELGNLIAYTRRHNILLVALTSQAESALAREADHVLLLPRVAEACPLGLAPTSSTTLSLVYGDALAVALLSRRHFTAQHFHRFHPGGKLGRALLRVGELMHKGCALPKVTRSCSMRETLLLSNQKRLGSAIVCNKDGTLCGIVTDGDLRRWLMRSEKASLETSVEEVMTANPQTISEQSSIAESLDTMNRRNITALVVVDDKQQVVGLLHLQDCLRAGQA